MLKLGVIGIGNAGNQIASLAAKNGFKAAAINTSGEDLQSVEDVFDDGMTFKLGKEGGCGKDRKLAIQVLKENFVDLLRFLDGFFDNLDQTWIVGSTGGGTNSGVLPILTNLLIKKYPEDNFANIVILPSDYESVVVQRNTIDCIGEMRNYSAPFMMYDNSRCKLNNPADLYNAVNNEVIMALRTLRGDFNEIITPIQMIDERDMFNIATTSGLLKVSAITNIKENDLDSIHNIDELMVSSIKNSLSVDLDRDKILERLGLIIDLPKTLLNKMDRNYQVLKDYVGVNRKGVFEHISENKADNGQIITILSGLTYPENKIQHIADVVNKDKENLSTSKQEKFDSIKDSVNWLESGDSKKRKSEAKKKVSISNDQLSDVFNKY